MTHGGGVGWWFLGVAGSHSEEGGYWGAEPGKRSSKDVPGVGEYNSVSCLNDMVSCDEFDLAQHENLYCVMDVMVSNMEVHSCCSMDPAKALLKCDKLKKAAIPHSHLLFDGWNMAGREI